MAEYTPNLNLLKKDPTTDGNDTFNIQTMLNDNWDILDEEVPKKASNIQDGRMSKEDKAKLDNIEEGANKYTHPSAHTANMITQNTERRFVSDTEKEAWNAKETPTGAQAKANAAAGTVQANLDEHSADDTKHVTSEERDTWNGKADKDGTLQSNLNAEKVGGYKVWVGTQTQYDAMGTKDTNTLYFVK